ncbi:pkhd-type hydroxylase tpa1 [Ophiostoma piceae UAMH 11346]|uniref:uS12 prolyl 3,4-dihydroxylase n=1 Tax=Ophiostoma piceae (strain UAMH 11346) TaxID=1262450 RepID=S3C1X3_OPHP1|nr:pkhd-type hydroxylase tpa1 [Ophiostoma piceae UAMH 11346]
MTTATKRKAEANLAKQAKRAKKAIAAPEAKSRFRKGLFDDGVLQSYTSEYATSAPYKHAVIHDLVNDTLLRSVRDEIRENVSFTPKETDIYKIHQSGDLANLDGLDDAALGKLPSLLSLRDALYSEAFRNYVSHITGCGALSGRKTDMAINVYTPGCYLLCHDDVIGSRKVSYILYLTDPDTPWQAEWGGALRLYPVSEQKGKPADGKNGEKSKHGKNSKKDVFAKTPGPDPVKIIPPAWNQLSFFAVQPGESFHDVEEVYHAPSPEELKKNGGRVRMAISGWFHIPQPGEDGFVQGAEEAQLKNSGLMQLQGNPDQHDRPLPKAVDVKSDAKADDDDEEDDFSQEDLEFLLQYIAPSYLTPDMLAEISEHFDDESSITLPNILKASFAAKVKADIEQREAAHKTSKKSKEHKDKAGEAGWHVAKPPHKHRFLYLQEGDAPASSPWRELLDVLLPSKPFRKWIEKATSTTITAHDLVARRFRRGKDYTLATGHDGDARLELNIGLTPTEGWGDEEEEEEEEDEEEEEEEEEEPKSKGKGKAAANGKGKKEDKASGTKSEKNDKNDKKNGKKEAKKPEVEEAEDKEDKEVGGLEVYMAGDEEGDDDAAIYKSATDDDNILFFQAAAWNKMTIVLRDSGTLRFVKYINRKAPGDRWDVSATFDIEEEDDDDDDDENENENGGDGNAGLESSEEEFNGFSSSDDSDSD